MCRKVHKRTCYFPRPSSMHRAIRSLKTTGFQSEGCSQLITAAEFHVYIQIVVCSLVIRGRGSLPRKALDQNCVFYITCEHYHPVAYAGVSRTTPWLIGRKLRTSNLNSACKADTYKTDKNYSCKFHFNLLSFTQN